MQELTVAQLKDRLRPLKVSMEGTKQQLQARLAEAEAGTSYSAETEQGNLDTSAPQLPVVQPAW